MAPYNMRVVILTLTKYQWISYLNLFALTALLIMVSCTTTSKPSPTITAKTMHAQTVDSHMHNVEIEKRLREEYRRWQGTRHRLGGTGSRGIDCSGFVKAVYKDVFNVDLPRTTKAQVKHGRSIPIKQLRPGDLVFFRPPTYPRHVGIYLGGSEFVHASKSKGVILSKIDQTYWGKYYWTARRILTNLE